MVTTISHLTFVSIEGLAEPSTGRCTAAIDIDSMIFAKGIGVQEAMSLMVAQYNK